MHSNIQSSYNNPPQEIFKAYDIRGIVGKTLSPTIAEAIGHAIGSEALARNQHTICLGYDGRLSSPELADALAAGILKSGADVIHLGLVATPVVYFSTYHLNTNCGVMVTGSHNPPEYNGVKMVIAGETLSGKAIQDLYHRIQSNDLASGRGKESHYQINQEYIQKISAHIKLSRPMKVAIDCGNGAAAVFAKSLYEAIGCVVEPLYCEVDGRFPNHHPDPSVPANLSDLITALESGQSEIGLAFDGDGDRLGVVTKDGQIIYPDRQLLLFAEDILRQNTGAKIIYDVKCTRNLSSWIKAHGGQAIMWKTGHSLIKAKMKETGAMLAGEMTGHLFFQDRWYGFDDGLYAGARLLEVLSQYDDPSATLNALPDSISTPELHIKMKEGEPHALIESLKKTAVFHNATLITVDGIRAEYTDGFGLIRASNTTPVLVLRFEADNASALQRIKDAFRHIILNAVPHATLPF